MFSAHRAACDDDLVLLVHERREVVLLYFKLKGAEKFGFLHRSSAYAITHTIQVRRGLSDDVLSSVAIGFEELFVPGLRAENKILTGVGHHQHSDSRLRCFKV